METKSFKHLIVWRKTYKKASIKNISAKMKTGLPADVYAVLKLIGTLAKSVNGKAYIVGGFVRDFFLGVRNLDVDITVEPSGIEFAEVLAGELKGKAVLHRRFGTASVFAKGPRRKPKGPDIHVMRIDITTARTEHYERPASLPEVKFSSIKDDLFRRDFTINAIAASLNPGSFGEVIDFFGGHQDILDGVVKVLHDGSFIDDPTRIFRAVRFEQRFNFRIEPHTMELIKKAVNLKMFGKVGKQRIRNEIILILKEKDPLRALLRMDELHELRFIHPKIKLNRKILRVIRSVEEAGVYFETISGKKGSVEIWLIYLMALFKEIAFKDVQRLCGDFCFRKSDRIRILSYKKKGARVLSFLERSGALAPSKVHRALEPLPLEVILLLYAEAGGRRARARIDNFLTGTSDIRLRIKGDDLKRLGMKPGPRFKDIFEKTLHAKIDGKLKTKKDEVQFVLRRFK